MKLSRTRLCAKTPEDNAEKTNVVWGPSKDFKHFNLKWLEIQGFGEEGKVTNYIRLVMERAVGLKKIVLLGEPPCEDCTDCETKSRVDVLNIVSIYGGVYKPYMCCNCACVLCILLEL